MKFINVRGCNGSGKTTLLRKLVQFVGEPASIRAAPAFGDEKPVPFTVFGVTGGTQLAVLGDYRPADAGKPLPTTAGCDRVKKQACVKFSLEWAARELGVNFILFEGVIVSTIFGPWREWSDAQGGMIWAFLDTPLFVCLERIQARNGGKPIREDLVEDKFESIDRVRHKAVMSDQDVFVLQHVDPLSGLLAIFKEYKDKGQA